MDNDKLIKLMDERIKKVVPQILQGSAYTDRKLGDTPTDNLSLVPRKYVTMNGNSANRPISSVQGQFYFDTTLAGGNGKPIWWSSVAGGFVDATGAIV